jgi:hypothetical protein
MLHGELDFGFNLYVDGRVLVFFKITGFWLKNHLFFPLRHCTDGLCPLLPILNPIIVVPPINVVNKLVNIPYTPLVAGGNDGFG